MVKVMWRFTASLITSRGFLFIQSYLHIHVGQGQCSWEEPGSHFSSCFYSTLGEGQSDVRSRHSPHRTSTTAPEIV